MPATEPDGFPYPSIGDDDNVPKDMKALADQIQSKYGAIDLSKLKVPGGEGDDGKLLLVRNGVVSIRSMTGDATITEEGNFQLGSKVVGTTELGDKAVSTAKLDDDSVTSAQIASDAVGSSEITAGAVGEAELGDGAVSSRKFKPTAGRLSLGEALALSAAEGKDVFSIPISVAVKSHLRLWVQFTRTSGGGNGAIDAFTKLDADADVIVGSMREGATQQESGTFAERVVLEPGEHTVKVRAKLKAGTGQLFGTLTRVIYDVIAV